MALLDIVLQLTVIGGFGLYAYATITRQSIGDVIRQIMEIIKSLQEQDG